MLGFDSKWAIHPSQVPVANEVFSPTPDEVAEARQAMETYREAEAAASGPSVATGSWSTPPTCGSPPIPCTRPRWRGGRNLRRLRGVAGRVRESAFPTGNGSERRQGPRPRRLPRVHDLGIVP